MHIYCKKCNKHTSNTFLKKFKALIGKFECNNNNNNNNNNSHNIKLKIQYHYKKCVFIAKSVINLQVTHFQKN